MKHIFWILLAVATSVVVACGKSGGGGGGDPVAPVNPSGVSSTINLAYYADNWSNSQSTFTVTNQTAFREFLRTSMGVCNRVENSGGTANCDAWVNGGFDMVLNVADVSTNKLAMTFRAWPQMNANYTYWYQLPPSTISGWAGAFLGVPPQATAGAYYNPLALGDFSISAVNNSAGFEARSYGPLYGFGNRSLIQVRVDNGHLGEAYFSYKLGYPNCVQDSTHKCSNPQNVWFATGTFKRCETASCAGPGGLW